jgi:chromosome segregation ATPase
MSAIDVLMERRRILAAAIPAHQREIENSQEQIEEMRREQDDIDAALAKLDPENYDVPKIAQIDAALGKRASIFGHPRIGGEGEVDPRDLDAGSGAPPDD